MYNRFKNYILFVLSLLIFVIWGISLINQSETLIEVPSDSGPKKSSQQGPTPANTPRRLDHIFKLLCEELGYKTFYTTVSDGLLSTQTRVLMIINPQRLLTVSEKASIRSWCSLGGTAVYISSFANDFFDAFKLKIFEEPMPSSFEVHSPNQPVGELKNVQGLVDEGTRVHFMPQRQDYVVLVRDGNSPTVVKFYIGSGAVILSSLGTSIDWEGIQKGDNSVFYVNIVSHCGKGLPVAFFDPDHYIQNPGVSDGGPGFTPTKLIKKKYDSLWSLIKANPVCLAMLQLLLVFFLYLHHHGKRLEKPLDTYSDPEKEARSYVKSLANLYSSTASNSLMLNNIYDAFYRDLLLKVG
ncbi:hypothetical protein HYY75_08840, partial [bacterium]|nr:hypothetical protein [bacterium]